MKTFATLIAAAAIVSGISVAAHAQATTKGGVAASTNAEFCLDIRGAKNCRYETMAACQKDAAGNGTCLKNPNFAAKDDAMKSKAMEPKSGAQNEMKKSSPIKQESDSVKRQ